MPSRVPTQVKTWFPELRGHCTTVHIPENDVICKVPTETAARTNKKKTPLLLSARGWRVYCACILSERKELRNQPVTRTSQPPKCFFFEGVLVTGTIRESE